MDGPTPAPGPVTTLADPAPGGRTAAPPARRGPSLRPALVVAGLALLIIIFFGVLAVVTNVTTPPPSTHPFAPRTVPGTGLVAIPATSALRPIQQLGEPPGNIVDAVAIPQRSTTVQVTNNAGEADQYDQQVTFSVPASQLQVVDFYKAEMDRLGWHIFSTGPARSPANAVEVLGQKGGSDGWYWEMGAVVSPTTFSSGGLQSAAGADVTRFTVRLFQVPDSN